MIPSAPTVRQWQTMYRAGAFEHEDDDTLALAGWSDFYTPLSDWRVRTLSQMVLNLTHPFILDNYHVYFVEHSPCQGPRYASACFNILGTGWDERQFSVDLNCPFQWERWALFTQRYGEGQAEHEFSGVRSLTHYIHTMADELEQGVKPSFFAERSAAEQLLFQLGYERFALPSREGEQSYHFWIPGTDERKTVYVARCLENAPPGFQVDKAVLIDGLYVYSPEGTERMPEAPYEVKRAAQKKKRGLER